MAARFHWSGKPGSFGCAGTARAVPEKARRATMTASADNAERRWIRLTCSIFDDEEVTAS
jgi:hypothetical protein